MGLSYATVNKFYRENFSPRPMVLQEAKRCTWVEHLKAQLQRIEGIDCSPPRYERWQNGAMLGFWVVESCAQYCSYHDSYFRLVIDQADQVFITGSEMTAPVGSEAEVVAFARACGDRVQRRHAQQHKREKVKHLKAQAMTAQIKQLANAEQFDFYIESSAAKLKLVIRLSAHDHVHIVIPFKRFQDAMPKLGEAIRAVQEQYASGIRLQVKSGQTAAINWIEHQRVHTY